MKSTPIELQFFFFIFKCREINNSIYFAFLKLVELFFTYKEFLKVIDVSNSVFHNIFVYPFICYTSKFQGFQSVQY